MKRIITLALAICGLGFLTGCEHEHGEHHHGGYYGGAPAPYQYGTGGYYNSYDGHWEHR